MRWFLFNYIKTNSTMAFCSGKLFTEKEMDDYGTGIYFFGTGI